MGRGATGRLLSLALPGRTFAFVAARFTFARGTLALPVVLAFLGFTFAFPFAGRFAFAARFAFAFVFPLAFSFVFLGFGRLGLFSLDVDEFVLRFSLGVSSGVTVSGDSPSLVGRLISIATVCPVFTTSPARGN